MNKAPMTLDEEARAHLLTLARTMIAADAAINSPFKKRATDRHPTPPPVEYTVKHIGRDEYSGNVRWEVLVRTSDFDAVVFFTTNNAVGV